MSHPTDQPHPTEQSYPTMQSSTQSPAPGWSTAAGPAPYSQPLAPQPAKRGAAAIVFAILTVLLLLTTLGMTGLFLLGKASADRTIADQEAQISTLTQDAAAQANKLSKTEKDLATARDQVDQSEACVEAVRAFFKAFKDNDEAGKERAVLSIVGSCPGIEL